MKNFENRVREDQRRIILEALARDQDYSHNTQIIRSCLDLMGHAISLDRTNSLLNDLMRRELIKLEKVSDNISVARLTQLGLDVAEGREIHDDVARRRPDA